MSYDMSNVDLGDKVYELVPESPKYTATVESVKKGTTSTGKENVAICYKLKETELKLWAFPLLDWIQDTLNHFGATSLENLVGKTAEISCYHEEYKGKISAKAGIPKTPLKNGEVVKVSLAIIPGGLGDSGLETQSKNNPNNKMLKVKLTVIEGEHTGRSFITNIMTDSDSKKTRSWGHRHIGRIGLACDLGLDMKNPDLGKIDGTVFFMEISFSDENGYKSNGIKEILIGESDSLGITKQAPASETDIDDEIPF